MGNKINENIFIENLKKEFIVNGELTEDSVNNVLNNMVSTVGWTPSQSKEIMSKLLYNNNFLNNQNYTISKNKKLQAYNGVNTKYSQSSWIHEYYNGIYGEYDKSILENNSSFGKVFLFFFLLAFAMPAIITLYNNIKDLKNAEWLSFFFLLLFFGFAAGIVGLMVHFVRKMKEKEGVLFDNDKIIIYNKKRF